MPVFEVELSDGRIVDVESDSQPDESSILSAIGSYQPEEPRSEIRAQATIPDSLQLTPQFDRGTDYNRAYVKPPEMPRFLTRAEAEGGSFGDPEPPRPPRIVPGESLGNGYYLPQIEEGDDPSAGQEIKPQDKFGQFIEETAQAPLRIGMMRRNDKGQYETEMGPMEVLTGDEWNPRSHTAIAVPLPGDVITHLFPDGKMKDVSVGLRNAAAGFLNFFLSPQGVAMGGLNAAKAPMALDEAYALARTGGDMRPLLQALRHPANRAVAGAFAVDMARHAPEALAAGDEAMKNGDLAGAIEHWAGGASQLVLAGLSAKHAAIPSAPRGGQNASEIQKAAEVHGDVRQQPDINKIQPLPIEEGGQRVQPQAEGRLQEIDRRIAELEADPEVTGKTITRLDEKGAPVVEENIKSDRKLSQLEQLRQLRERELASAPLTAEEQTNYSSLRDKFFRGEEMADAEIQALDAFDARSRAQMQGRVNAEPVEGMISEVERLLSDAVNKEKLGDKVEIVGPDKIKANSPLSGRIAQWNDATGKIEINGRALVEDMQALSPRERREYIDSMVNEEGIHSRTKLEDALEFMHNSSWVERRLAEKIYSGKWKKTLTPEQLGYEMVRRRIQHLSRVKPTEIALAVKSQRWKVQSLDILDRIIKNTREMLGTKASQRQLDILDRVEKNIGIAKDEAAKLAIGAPRRTNREDVEKLKPEDFFAEAQGWAKEAMSAEGGVSPQIRAEMAALSDPNIEAWRAASEAAGKEADAIRDEVKANPQLMSDINVQRRWSGAAQKAQFFNEGLAMLTGDKAPDARTIQLMSEQTVGAPRRDLSENQQRAYDSLEQFGDWIRQYFNYFFGTDPRNMQDMMGLMDIILNEPQSKWPFPKKDIETFQKMLGPEGNREIEKLKSNWEKLSESELNDLYDKLEPGTEDQQSFAAAPRRGIGKREAERIEEQRKYRELMLAKEQKGRKATVEEAGAAMSRRMAAEPITPDAVGKAAGEVLNEQVPSFNSFVDKLKTRHGTSVQPGQVAEAWADAVWSKLQKASGAELEKMVNDLGLRRQVFGKIQQGSKTLGLPEGPPPVLTRSGKIADAGIDTGGIELARSKAMDRATRLSKRADELQRQAERPITADQRARPQDAERQKLELKQKAEILRRTAANLEAAAKSGEGMPAQQTDLFGGEEAVRPTDFRDPVRGGMVKARDRAISAIARHLLSQRPSLRAGLNRKSVGPEDVRWSDVGNEIKNVRKEDLENLDQLGYELTERASTDASTKRIAGGGRYVVKEEALPRSATKRVVALLDTRTKKVYLVSAYRDGRRGPVFLDPGSVTGEHRSLSELRRYRPMFSIPLDSPVQNFKQEFASTKEFTEQFYGQLNKMSQRVGLRGIGERPEIEGTEGLGGQGGMFMGPEADLARAELAMVEGARESGADITPQEARSVYEAFRPMESREDIARLMSGLRQKAEKNQLKAKDWLLITAMSKVHESLRDLYRNEGAEALAAGAKELTQQQIADLTLQELYDLSKRNETSRSFVNASQRQFAEGLGILAEAGKEEAPSPTARELTMRSRRPPTDISRAEPGQAEVPTGADPNRPAGLPVEPVRQPPGVERQLYKLRSRERRIREGAKSKREYEPQSYPASGVPSPEPTSPTPERRARITRDVNQIADRIANPEAPRPEPPAEPTGPQQGEMTFGALRRTKSPQSDKVYDYVSKLSDGNFGKFFDRYVSIIDSNVWAARSFFKVAEELRKLTDISESEWRSGEGVYAVADAIRERGISNLSKEAEKAGIGGMLDDLAEALYYENIIPPENTQIEMTFGAMRRVDQRPGFWEDKWKDVTKSIGETLSKARFEIENGVNDQNFFALKSQLNGLEGNLRTLIRETGLQIDPMDGLPVWETVRSDKFNQAAHFVDLLERTQKLQAKLPDSSAGLQSEMEIGALRRNPGRTVGEKVSNILTDFGSIYDKWMVDRLAEYGGRITQGAVPVFRGIIDRQKELYGQLTPLLDRARRLAGGIETNRGASLWGMARDLPRQARESIKAQRAAAWMSGVSRVTADAGTSRMHLALEGRIPIPSWARALVDLARMSNLEIGRMLQAVIPGFIASGSVQRNLTGLGYDIIRSGGGPLWEKWVEGTWRANRRYGATRFGVESQFAKLKEILDDPLSTAEQIEKVNQDMARLYPEVITHVRQGGRWQEVVHSNLFNYLEQTAQRATHVRAFREQFPMDAGGRSAFRQLVTDMRRELTPEVNRDLDGLIRAINGHPTDEYGGGWQDYLRLGPQQAGGAAMRMMNQTVNNILSRAVLTGQMVTQTPELLFGATPQKLGYRNYLRSVARVRDLYTQLELTGAVNRVMHDYTFSQSSPVRSLFRMGGNAISKVSMQAMLNELQEALAAATARITTEDIVNNRLSSWQRRMLPQTFREMGFNPTEVQAMMRGDQTLLGEFQRKAASFLTGGNKSIAEGSRLGANRLFNSVFRFQTYPMMKMNQARNTLTTLWDAWHGGTPEEKSAATRSAARFFAGNVMQGATLSMLSSLMFGGTSGLIVNVNEAKDEPFKFIGESFLAAMGGPLYILWRGARYGGIKGIGEQGLRAAFPYAVANEMQDMWDGAGKYRDKDAFDRVGTFVANKTPGLRMLQTGAAMFGLGNESQALDQAIAGFRRWRANEQGYRREDSRLENDERAEFRQHVLKAMDAMKAGDTDRYVEEWLKAVDAKDQKSFRQSMERRKILVDVNGAKLTEEMVESLQKRIGMDAYNRLEWYDMMLDAAASGAIPQP